MTHSTTSIRSVNSADWPNICKSFSDLTYEQTLTYGQAAAQRIGARTEFLVLEEDNTPLAAACIRIKSVPGLGRGIAWIASGPMMQRRGAAQPSESELQTVLAALRNHICSQKGHVLRLRPPAVGCHKADTFARAAATAGYAPTDRAAAYATVALELSQDEDALMRGLHGKWRNMLRSALKAGIEVDCGPIADMSERFHKLYEQVQKAKGFRPDIPPEFYYPLAGPDFEHEVLIARKDGVDLAAITIGRAGDNSVYLFGATTESGRRLNAGYFLIWQGILDGRNRKLHWFDLGGIDAETNPDVTRFKRRTGGLELIAPGPYEARPNGLTMRLIKAAETLHTRFRNHR